MPHYFDFKVFNKEDIKEIEIRNLEGWVNPITIEYAYANFASTKMTLYWRIKGTAHTFTITATEFNVLSKGDPEKHFSEVLVNFRDEITEWYDSGLPEPWMREYLYMYKNYITV